MSAAVAVVQNDELESCRPGDRVRIWTPNPPRVKGIDGWMTWVVVALPGDGWAVIRPQSDACASAFAEIMDGKAIKRGHVDTLAGLP